MFTCFRRDLVRMSIFTGGISCVLLPWLTALGVAGLSVAAVGGCAHNRQAIPTDRMRLSKYQAFVLTWSASDHQNALSYLDSGQWKVTSESQPVLVWLWPLDKDQMSLTARLDTVSKDSASHITFTEEDALGRIIHDFAIASHKGEQAVDLLSELEMAEVLLAPFISYIDATGQLPDSLASACSEQRLGIVREPFEAIQSKYGPIYYKIDAPAKSVFVRFINRAAIVTYRISKESVAFPSPERVNSGAESDAKDGWREMQELTPADLFCQPRLSYEGLPGS